MCPQIFDPQIFIVVQTSLSNSRLTYTVFNLHSHCVSWKHLNLTCSKLNSSFPTNLFTQNKSHSSCNGLESFPWHGPLPFDLPSTIPPPSSQSMPAKASFFFFIEYLRYISVCGVCHGYSLRLYLSLPNLMWPTPSWISSVPKCHFYPWSPPWILHLKSQPFPTHMTSPLVLLCFFFLKI